jgi:hypothetical protein
MFRTFFLFVILMFVYSTSQATETFNVSNFDFQVPQGWRQLQPNSPMRKAHLQVLGENSKAVADVLFFYFGNGEGGDRDANIKRWIHQFQTLDAPEKVETIQVKKTHITFVEAQGTFNQGMPGQSFTIVKNYALLGAILEDDQGNVFVKMIGPELIVKNARDTFRNMIQQSVK